MTSIGGSAFYGCSGLASVTIPGSVTTIGNYAFYNCSGLTSVTFKNTSVWKVYDSSTATNGTSVTVTNTSQYAQYLTDSYGSYIWERT